MAVPHPHVHLEATAQNRLDLRCSGEREKENFLMVIKFLMDPVLSLPAIKTTNLCQQNHYAAAAEQILTFSVFRL